MPSNLPKKHRPKHVSASQLRTYTDCPRKWWIEKVGGLAPPTSRAAEFGVRVHWLLEKRLLHGEWREQPGDVPGRIWTNDREMGVALQQDRTLPSTPVDPSCVETRWRIEQDYLALPLIGVIDWIEPELRRITDHKTTKSPFWMKKSAELYTDIQGRIYGAAAHLLYGWGVVHFRHLYYITGTGKIPSHLTSQTTYDGAGLAKWLEHRIAPMVAQMAEMATLPDLAGVPYPDSMDPCKKYGGCPFKDHCPRFHSPHTHATKEEDMDLASAAKANAARQQAHADEETPAIVTGIVSPQAPTEEEKPFAPVLPPKPEKVISAKMEAAIVAASERLENPSGDHRKRPPPPPAAPQDIVDLAFATVPNENVPVNSSKGVAGGTLYVNCAPRNNRDIVWFEKWSMPYIEKACADMGVETLWGLPYGQHKTAFQVVLQQALTAGDPLPKC